MLPTVRVLRYAAEIDMGEGAGNQELSGIIQIKGLTGSQKNLVSEV